MDDAYDPDNTIITVPIKQLPQVEEELKADDLIGDEN
jgi:hypothetical protein